MDGVPGGIPMDLEHTKEKNKAEADPESFVHRVRKKYQVVDKDAIDRRLNKAKEELRTEPERSYGYPPGIYWMRRDQEERVKQIKLREKLRSEGK